MTYGNLAYKYDYREDESIRAKQKTKAKQNMARSTEANKSHGLSFFGKTACVFVVTAAAIFMIIQFIQVNETLTALNEAQSRYEFEESATAQKAFELEQSIDLSKIEQEATTRLGMQRPEKHQIVYLDVPQDDTTEKTADEVEGVTNRFSKGIKNFISNIVEYFSI